MVKLAIVEDELLMSDFLKTCINYEAMGITVTGVYCDGSEALDAFRSEMPDIIITDIKMPEVDGVTLLSECITLDSNVRFVVISNYQDFHVVKNVMGMGVCDYILKTEFDVENYKSVLEGIVKQIGGVRELDMGDTMSKNHQLKQLFWNNAKSLSDSTYSLRLFGEKIRMGVIFIVNHDAIVREQWDMSKELMQVGLANYFEEVLEKQDNGEIIFNSYDELILIVSEEKLDVKLEKFMEECFSFLKEFFQLDAFGVIGRCLYSGESMRNKYEELRKWKSIYFVAEHNVLSEDEIKSEYTEIFNGHDEAKDFERNLIKFEFDIIAGKLKSMKEKKFSLKSIGALREFAETLAIGIDDTLNVKGNSGKAIRDKVENADTFREMLDILIERVEEATKNAPQKSEKSSIEQYMRNNYARALTLNEVAETFNYEYNYFSKYFLKLTGKTFKKYLNDLRLETARDLILSTDFKCNEIARMVGYSNYEHFSRAYNKKFGKWPNEMRSR